MKHLFLIALFATSFCANSQISEKTKAEAEFKRLAAEKEAKIAEERRKAASVSKKKVVKKPETKPKLEELSGNDFRAEFNKMLMS